jgi:hypothetical protein
MMVPAPAVSASILSEHVSAVVALPELVLLELPEPVLPELLLFELLDLLLALLELLPPALPDEPDLLLAAADDPEASTTLDVLAGLGCTVSLAVLEGLG